MTAALDEAGLVAVRSADDDPVAVIQGYGFDLKWQELNEAAIAIHGAHCGDQRRSDTTDRPWAGSGKRRGGDRSEDGRAGRAGRWRKPYRPLLDDTVERLAARHPLFVGDRLDTDIAGAVNAGLDSMLVLSGSHRAEELLAAPGERPTHVGEDLRALLRPVLIVSQTNGEFRCGQAAASAVDGHLMVHRNASSRIEAIWVAACATWWAVDHGLALDWRDALEQLREPLR